MIVVKTSAMLELLVQTPLGTRDPATSPVLALLPEAGNKPNLGDHQHTAQIGPPQKLPVSGILL